MESVVESYQKLKREETKLSTSLQEAVESRPLKDSTQTDAAVVKIYFQEAVMCGTPSRSRACAGHDKMATAFQGPL